MSTVEKLIEKWHAEAIRCNNLRCDAFARGEWGIASDYGNRAVTFEERAEELRRAIENDRAAIDTHTPTPRTDAAVVESLVCTDGGDDECTVYPAVEHVEADFARELECENAKLRQQLKDADEDTKAERYYRDAPQSHE